MTYANVDTIAMAARTGGDIRGQIEVGLLKQASTRATVVSNTDPKEDSICRAIIEGAKPSTWVTMVLEVLDIQGHLTGPTDAQVDTAIATTWTYLLASRNLG